MLASGGSPAAAETLLRFSTSAAVAVTPDELVANLRAETSAATASLAQTQVNAAVGAAIAAVRAVPSIAIDTGAYDVWHVTEPHPQWLASQALRLSSRDGAALLALVGTLQAKGLALGGLDWRLSDALARKSRDAAMRDAIGMLRDRATAAAALLGLRFDSFKSVSLAEGGAETAVPHAMLAMKAVAPVAVSEAITVTATAEADAILQPK